METSMIQKLEKDTSEVVAKANSFVITTKEMCIEAREYLKVIMGMKKTVVADFRESKEKAKAAHKAICDQEAGHLAPLETAESLLKTKAMAWDNEQVRIAREAQAKLDAAAKAEEDKKRKALEERARKAEAEARAEREKKEKAEAEARAAQEAQRRAEEAAKAAKNAKERAIAAKAEAEARERAEVARREAAEAEARAAKQDAKNEALKEQAEEVHVAAPIVQAQTAEVKGQATIDTYDAEIENEALVPDQWWIVDIEAVKKFVKSTKGSRPIPGIKIITGKRMSSRA